MANTPTRYKLVSMAIAAAKEFAPENCVTDVAYDRRDRCWYARFMQLSSGWEYKQHPEMPIGFGSTPEEAVISLKENMQ